VSVLSAIEAFAGLLGFLVTVPAVGLLRCRLRAASGHELPLEELKVLLFALALCFSASSSSRLRRKYSAALPRSA
jgi:hypothetical protein